MLDCYYVETVKDNSINEKRIVNNFVLHLVLFF